jgi:hypothetical protein
MTDKAYKRNRELPTKDWLDYRNARELAGVITSYWRKKGFKVEVSIEPVELLVPSNEYLYQIRSNLFRGLPRGV